MNEDNFYSWLRSQKYTAIFSILCAFLPIVPSLFDKSGFQFNEMNLNWLNLANAIFILVVLFFLVNSKFLINKDSEDKEKQLSTYIKVNIGPNCRLLHNGEHDFFHRMDISLKQFYYSWIVVWGIWLLMYLLKFVFNLFDNFNLTFGALDSTANIVENTLNLLNSFAMFFIYMVITFSTVKASTDDGDCKQTHLGVVFLFLIGTLCLGADIVGLYTPFDYVNLQFTIRLFIGIIASLSMMMVLGRLNSSYLDLPQRLILSLYVYAAIQMLYPLMYLLDANVLSKSNIFMREKISIQLLFYFLAFAGKICLFIMILWIIRRKRFLFFLVHKAHSLAESDEMIETFDRTFNGYSEYKEDL